MAQEKEIKKVLYITMSNLGDVLMALPAFDFLRRECPQARITVVAAPRTKCVFENHPAVDRLIVYDKHAGLRQKRDLFFELRKERFDAVVDLKDSFFRWGLPAARKNPAWVRFPDWCAHSSARHLFKTVAAFRDAVPGEEEFSELGLRRNPSFITAQDEAFVEALLKAGGIAAGEEFVLLVPGARSLLKKWPKEGFIEVARAVRKTYGFPVIVAGDKNDQADVAEIVREAGAGAVDLAGRTSFGQLCSLILRSKLIICNDSGALHIASYLDKPVVGIYGPSDYKEYGPWSKKGIVVRKDLLCVPCGKAHCRRSSPDCISTIKPYDVLLAVRLLLESDQGKVKESRYKRILVVRTDRIGDVLLSTPVLKVLRDHYPTSVLAMMVSPYTRELVEGNPYLDRVIVFDKDKHKGFLSTLSFAQKLKKERFDVALVLHPTVRVHFLLFLAGIPERIGYDWKAPYFLTQALPHRKQEGRRHEADYNFDLLRPLGITQRRYELTMPIREASERSVEKALKEQNLAPGDALVAVNPAASCLSKLWPVEKFAQVIDRLTQAFGVRVLVVADARHKDISDRLMKLTRHKPIDLSGRFSLSELASLFKRCRLVVSNDSGPVHIAVAVGTPVISIFGRNQPGLGPVRWGPLGSSGVALHKKTECSPCLAHACVKGFECLEAIGVDEVLSAAGRLLKEKG